MLFSRKNSIFECALKTNKLKLMLMKNIFRNLRFWSILVMTALSCTHLHAMQRGMFRIFHDWTLSLTTEEYQQRVSVALAAIEKEKPEYLQYIDTQDMTVNLSGRIYEIDDEEKPYIPSTLPFYYLESGARYCKVTFHCKIEHLDRFTSGVVAKVYVRTADNMPFCIEWIDSGKEQILIYKEAPSLEAINLLPTKRVIPRGMAEVTEEVKERFVTLALEGVKKAMPHWYNELIPNAVPILTRFWACNGEEEVRPGLQVVLFARGVRIPVCILEDTGEVIGMYTDET